MAEDILTLEPERLIDRYGGRQAIDRYYRLLMELNQNVNLVSRETSRADFDRMVAESLFPLDLLPDRSRGYLDIGSGGGMPSIPILLSGVVDGSADLVERTAKKARALGQMVDDLDLTAQVIPKNFEEISDLPQAGLITLRYVKLTERLLAKIMALLGPNGKFVYYSSPEFKIRNYSFLARKFVSPQNPAVKAVTVFSI